MKNYIFIDDDKNYNDKNNTIAQKSQLQVRFCIRYQIMYSVFIAGSILLKLLPVQ